MMAVPFVLVLAVSPVVLGAAAESSSRRPNLVLILADDLGFSDVGCFGSEIATPNLDRLAKGGVAFTQFYNQARCCPTRAALLTGRYPHQVGIGDMIDDYAAAARAAARSPAYQDHLSTESPTVAEILRAAGYRTLMSGKWHLGKRPDEWPVKRGFDRSFVQIDGAMNYYGGDSGEGPRARMAIDAHPYVPPHDGFYSTDAFTDHAIEYLNETVKKDPEKPFFLYLAYNASHWPLQAPEAEVATYQGKYDDGWQAIRRARLMRQIELGVVPQGQKMAAMDRGTARPWNRIDEARRREWARRMEVFAAQTEHLDRAVGRVLDAIERLGIKENTLIVFLSDNGGAAEDPNRGKSSAPIGDRDSFRGYGRPWATVSNTPWRLHKITAYEGGISTPLIASWPAGIPAERRGTLVREPAHIIDLLPTFLALAEASYPEGKPGTVPEGKNIAPMLSGKPGTPDRMFFWEHEGHRAVRHGQWKLVSLAAGKGEWELYDIETDRIESRDVAAEHPDIVRRLGEEYDRWAARCGVVPRETIQPQARGTQK